MILTFLDIYRLYWYDYKAFESTNARCCDVGVIYCNCKGFEVLDHQNIGDELLNECSSCAIILINNCILFSIICERFNLEFWGDKYEKICNIIGKQSENAKLYCKRIKDLSKKNPEASKKNARAELIKMGVLSNDGKHKETIVSWEWQLCMKSSRI